MPLIVQNLCSPTLLFPPKKSINPTPFCCHSRRGSTSTSSCRSSASSAKSLDTSSFGSIRSSDSSVLYYEEAKSRIRKLFDRADLSASSYDTAWVAMIPDPHNSRAPLFPMCTEWLMDNQLQDGSWSLPHHHPRLLKDVLSSTLASVLALKKWGVGDEQVHRGVHFIQLNFASACNDHQFSPIGFDIIFPGMLEYAIDLNLNLHLDSRLLAALLHNRDFVLRRFYESNSKDSKEYLAYISEGMVNLKNWDIAMKFQRKNGSLFNSPSATAAAVLHAQNPDCICYLNSIFENFGPAVPAVYPLDIYARLCLVDNLERLGICRHFQEEVQNVLHDTHSSSNFSNEDFLSLAVQDFNDCQIIHREELKQLERWVVENRLDKLKFARQKCAYCYFSAAATIFSPEFSDARMSWAKNGVLTTVVDDFCDVGGSIEELKNLIDMIEKWDVKDRNDCCSEHVEIIFSAIRTTINEVGHKALKWQGRDVTGHIIDIWLALLNSMLREAEWARRRTRPKMEEYMANAYVSFALGPIILPALYLVGPKLSEEVGNGSEMHSLFKLVSTCGRVLNDIQSFERESKDGKLNALSLRLIESGDGINEVAAIEEMNSLVENQRRELLRLVLQKKGSVVPRACKDLFWNMSKVLHQFYIKDDGFTSQELIELVKSIIHEPLSFNK